MRDRALEGNGRGLRVSEGRHMDPTHGRQDKSAAIRRAQIVGRIEIFMHSPRTPDGGPGAFLNVFNAPSAIR